MIDYGLVDQVHPSSLFAIEKNSKLAELPRLAFHARLANVKPIGNQWSEEAISYFYSCVSDRELLITQNVQSTPPVPVKLIRYSSKLNLKNGACNITLDIAEDMANQKYLNLTKQNP
ncbi:hypothetical protein RF11_15944 [Thelohanellus kitauei]|uniref:Uncharacterized protein n=1 Tax=Thelohanellus kitauei TaxID=669202 RepID=A0A0C2MQ58_THEKT|nr:hypothetical protein RF11_15944 [Thelohanellus kitauei]